MTTADANAQARHLVVEGRVQGVGFRWFVRERARRLSLKGWVRNRPDGAVEVMAAGTQQAMTQFVRDLSVGPPGASVSAVRDIAAVPPQPAEDPKPDETLAGGALPFPFVIQR